jgi:2-polyprenyl-3-methyl-5-hydroxy-6-metoxy-1,4-benzoquinol methylase
MQEEQFIKKLKRHRLGFFQVHPFPSKDKLQKYYRDKYYQKPVVATYSRKYSEPEIALGKINCEVTDYIYKRIRPKSRKTVLDVGCGEGFFLKGLEMMRWKIFGTDYSSQGIKIHNPSILKRIRFGPAENVLTELTNEKKEYSLINLGNILEHVLDPISLLKTTRSLLIANGVLRVVVPNDSSGFQALLKNAKRSRGSWIHPPDHLSYFNFQSLITVLSYCGYTSLFTLGDFPIELYLLNKHSNYEIQRKRGAEAHFARVKTVNFVRSHGIEKYIQWAAGLAAGGTSRSCIVFAKKT